MDRQLQETIIKGDTEAFLSLLHQHPPEIIAAAAAPPSGNTVLHVAARLGHVALAAEILRVFPEMATAENHLLETPFHTAAREGHAELVRLLAEADPDTVVKVNGYGESAVFMAADRGRVEVVRWLLGLWPWLLTLEVDALTSTTSTTTSLHVAASNGHIEVVKEIIEIRPDFAHKKDKNGFTPLHLSCSKGHLEITRELLRLDSDLSTVQDDQGRTPLHWAAVKGRVAILDEILSASLESTAIRTYNGETVLHLGVKNNQYEAVKYLVEKIDVTPLMNLQDNDGNTVLHLATVAKLNTMVVYLLKLDKLGLDLNVINRRGFTALDVIEADASNSGTLVILPALLETGAKRCDQLPPAGSPEITQELLSRTVLPVHRPNGFPNSPAKNTRRKNHRMTREKHIELQNEGLRNARKTITVVAVLIATVTYSGGINPPGGFNQQTGKTLMGKKVSFKVFMVCNIIALFLSLSIVTFLVSIIPFKRRSLMKLLTITHKVMWVSMSFMAVAYIAGVWTTLPHGRGTIWVLATLVAVGGGCTVAIFAGLGVLTARHWVKKWEWRRKVKDGSSKGSISSLGEMQTGRRGGSHESSNSDIDSSDHGYHLY
ncbi:PREDICTED: ankyrin repeat-containing protein NPR4-like [Tarenaya hassleriana]|uniref:ankyrin repeat-containing protein NPR4-like n=1 Tax=Tarenaya hassleriana TaxID=28532 RepID=UPI00053C8F30|nr:PREDICTED: ankyrin repeat-containing protein NPR4-like [Tarenaya hassleriana]